MDQPQRFTKIYRMKDGTIGRKSGIHLTKNFSYLEPASLKEKETDREGIPCTKIFYNDKYIMIEMRPADFILAISHKVEFI